MSDAEEDNPDERVSQRDADRKIACDEELSDSDDESGGRRDHHSHGPAPPGAAAAVAPAAVPGAATMEEGDSDGTSEDDGMAWRECFSYE